MDIIELIKLFDAKIICGNDFDRVIKKNFCGNLLDLVNVVGDENTLLTCNHLSEDTIQIVKAVGIKQILVSQFIINDEVVDMANKYNIAILQTEFEKNEICKMLKSEGVK